jgi:hypothetical protein
MKNPPARRLYALLGLAAAIVFAATPAAAQYKPRPLNDPATGETYHIEASAGLWYPTAEIQIASESLGLGGTTIDFKNDLGMGDKKLPAFQLQLRPGRKHKFRFQYIPIKYDQTTTLKRDIIFNGQRYTVNLPVTSSLEWKAYRFGYEYDFISRNKGFAGLILEAKYTEVTASLAAARINEFTTARAPIPAIGGIARVYVVPNISLTGEVTGFTVPKSLADRISTGSNAHYVDVDVYATVNFTNSIGVQGGYRSMDIGYFFRPDTGSLNLHGIYIGAVLRY